MKRFILALIVGLAVGAVAAVAAEKNPNITDAENFMSQALAKISDAQKANEFDMGGHAQKAKDLVTQAQGEMQQAESIADQPKK